MQNLYNSEATNFSSNLDSITNSNSTNTNTNTNTSNNQIQILSNYLIDQIKAGEVIENPSLLIKEILENSIDAKATSIELTIENIGLDLIRIKDNGCGMSFSELPLAFTRHATSKINKLEDLYNLYSFGFRGEALASIASISKVRCQSAPKNNIKTGGLIEIHGNSQIIHSKNFKSSHGSILTIKDLFFNTPVRLKFLKSKSSQKKELMKIINAFLISNPNIKFILKFDDHDRKIFMPSTSKLERFTTLTKKIDHKDIYTFNFNYEQFNINCLILNNSKAKNLKYIFINDRYIIDNSLINIFNQFFEDKLKTKCNAGILLDITIDPKKIDVNIHPNKTRVNYPDKNILFASIRSQLNKIFQPLQNLEEQENQDTKDFKMDNFFNFNSNIFSNFIDKNYYFFSNKNNEPIIINLKKLFNLLVEKAKSNDVESVPIRVLYPTKSLSIKILNDFNFTIVNIEGQTFINALPEPLSFLNLDIFCNHYLSNLKQEDTIQDYNIFFSQIILSQLLSEFLDEWLDQHIALRLNNDTLKRLF